MWLALLMALGSAQATPPVKEPEHWAQVETRASRTFQVGWLMSFAGTCSEIAGFLVDDNYVKIGGAVSQKTGVAVMLSSGLRERRAIVAQGGSVGSGWGVTGWVLWTMGGSIDLAEPWIQSRLLKIYPGMPSAGMELATMGTAIGSHILAVGQHRHNRLAAARRGEARAGQIQWNLRPVLGARFAGGQVLGRF